MTLRWTNFAKTGDPNNIKGDDADWPMVVSGQQKTLIFDVKEVNFQQENSLILHNR